MAASGRSRQHSDRIEADERRLYTATVPWGVWLRRDFLRSCFVGACLVWLGLGVVEVRYLLDPWYPGQGAPSAGVWGAMIAFLVGSIALQVLLYRRWWPSGGRHLEVLDDIRARSLERKQS